jgi:hypothetical protein
MGGRAFFFGGDVKTRKQYRDELMKKAYEKVGHGLDADPPGKAIDDLVKLLKADKDLADDEANGKEVDLEWNPSKSEPRDE